MKQYLCICLFIRLSVNSCDKITTSTSILGKSFQFCLMQDFQHRRWGLIHCTSISWEKNANNRNLLFLSIYFGKHFSINWNCCWRILEMHTSLRCGHRILANLVKVRYKVVKMTCWEKILENNLIRSSCLVLVISFPVCFINFLIPKNWRLTTVCP